MGAGDLVAYSGYMGGRGPAAYSGYMGARGHGYMGEEIQLLTVGTWGQGGMVTWGRGSSCLQLVHEVGICGGRGPAANSGYMWARGLAAYSGYMGQGGVGT